MCKPCYQLLSILSCLTTFCFLASCNRSNTGTSGSADGNQPVVTSTTEIPLRMWVVAPIASRDNFVRQWQSGSEQQLDIRSLTVEELLQESSCDCDVIVYPSRLTGELVSREWLTKLPSSLTAQNGVAPVEGVSDNVLFQPPAWAFQASYGASTYGMSLGCSLPIAIASPALAAELQPLLNESNQLTWEQISPKLKQSEPSNTWPGSTDIDALVDRFLALATSFSARNSKYGLLFEMQTMQARLTAPEFHRAAEMLILLAKQDPTAVAAMGTHSAVWQWVSEAQESAIGLAVPSSLDTTSATLKGATVFHLMLTPVVDPKSSVSTQLDTQQPRQLSYNGGSGLVASISVECRQSGLASFLLKWLQESASRNVIAPLIPGIDPATSLGGTDSTERRARQLLRDSWASDTVPAEPRLPRVEEYRHALGMHLVKLIRGEVAIDEALKSANDDWNRISEDAGTGQRNQYEKSLGLTM
ncbi:MAG: hypothetical protein KDB03_23070 [Planctomycetales bacterium]|nr:hypothetical protein [Planctomycetales bacterium]